MSEVKLITQSNQIVVPDIEQSYKAIIDQRRYGMPVAYLIGTKEFWSLQFKVTQDTLIPRPETELLVETALELIDEELPHQVLDLGTGTGAIAVAIANSRPRAYVTGSDNSKAALQVAIENAEHQHLTNIRFCDSNWFEKFEGQQFDVIISNPPYIREDDPHLTHEDIKHEPVCALTSGMSGLDDLRTIIMQASRFLKHQGWLITEHGYDQADEVGVLFRNNGFEKIKNLNDINQTPRLTMGQYRR